LASVTRRVYGFRGSLTVDCAANEWVPFVVSTVSASFAKRVAYLFNGCFDIIFA